MTFGAPFGTPGPLPPLPRPDAPVRLTPGQIRGLSLRGVGPWGRAYLRSVLAALADQVADMAAETTAARQRVRERELEIEQRRYGVGLPARRADQEADERLLRRQVEAQRLSDDLTATAQRQAAEIVAAAREQADRIRATQPGFDYL
jgi:hypothetical protein